MDTIKELREICQGQKLRQKRYSWWLRYVSRRISIYLTALVIKTSITPNQITFISLITGLVMVGFFLKGVSWAILAGVLLFQFFYIIDCVDGELARYRSYIEMKTTGIVPHKLAHNLTGTFFDSFLHYLLQPCLFFFLALGQYKALGSFYIIILGFIAAISIPFIAILNDCRAKCILSRLEESREITVKIKSQSNRKEEQGRSAFIFSKGVFSFLHHTCFFYNIMNVLSIVAILNILIPHFYLGRFKLNWVVLFLGYYATVATIVWTFKITKIIIRDEINQEAIRGFEIMKDRH